MDRTALVDETVGVLVVHGIGEQRRFEHVDAQVREVIRALRAVHGEAVTVEVLGGTSASFHADQESWRLDGAPVRVVVRERDTGRLVKIHFHEVWWADSNEPYSFAKQARFWAWGLAIAAVPRKRRSTSPGASVMRDPIPPGASSDDQIVSVRLRLFAVSVIAVIGAASIGLVTVLAKRLLNLEPPNFVKVFVNYVAGVKLYSQKQRLAGLFGSNADFLDSMDQPPRVAVRRRMIRAIAQVALERYDRWYLMAHSLGTVVAFNGLMESSGSWPGYFDEQGWNALVTAGFAGPVAPGCPPPAVSMSPPRPVWCDPSHIAYRSALFERLHGVLTMGSPLEKFATLWPGRVPINAEPAFREGTTWISVYDPLDPVSGVLRAFDRKNPHELPSPETIGYAASPILLLSHIRYLTWRPGGGTLADGVAEWVMTGSRRLIPPPGPNPRWFAFCNAPPGPNQSTPAADSAHHRRRTAGAYAWWAGAAIVLVMLGSLSLRLVGSAVAAAAKAAWAAVF